MFPYVKGLDDYTLQTDMFRDHITSEVISLVSAGRKTIRKIGFSVH